MYRFWFTFTSTTTYLEDPSNPVVRSANSTEVEVTLLPVVPELPVMPSVWLKGPSMVNPGQALRVSGGSLTVLLMEQECHRPVPACQENSRIVQVVSVCFKLAQVLFGVVVGPERFSPRILSADLVVLLTPLLLRWWDLGHSLPHGV